VNANFAVRKPNFGFILQRANNWIQRAVKYFTFCWSYSVRWSLEREVNWYFIARQSEENGHVKKERGRKISDYPEK
jgi:hypothetical protein